MQTFLPYPKFDSICLIDKQRLNKQILEASSIAKYFLEEKQFGYSNHPCVIMWKEYIPQFCDYLSACCSIYKNLYGRTDLINNTEGLLFRNRTKYYNIEFVSPEFITEEFCKRHRAALKFKVEYKYLIYLYSYMFQTPINQVPTTSRQFYELLEKTNSIKSENAILYGNKINLESDAICSDRVLSSAEELIKWYQNRFDDYFKLETKIDYLWG